jgi:hypothetical protein
MKKQNVLLALICVAPLFLASCMSVPRPIPRPAVVVHNYISASENLSQNDLAQQSLEADHRFIDNLITKEIVGEVSGSKWGRVNIYKFESDYLGTSYRAFVLKGREVRCLDLISEVPIDNSALVERFSGFLDKLRF